MLIHQIKFSLVNMSDKQDENKAYECEQFQSALMADIEKYKLPITTARLDDVEITGGYDSTVKSVAVSFDAETQTGKLVVEFTDGTAGMVGFDDKDMVTSHIDDEMLHIVVRPVVPFLGE